ncbi:MAG: hypothetical protein HY785_00200 [Oscillatoriophycideae cyanobacterium NC_groundwater_1537_Pr4_S-0.65um_50_18]|nr:hypothetical protein [Oscillatoriophycideae cyanobacterium NC_groundwater_1537_Pr4_S-0.65um_50_18]
MTTEFNELLTDHPADRSQIWLIGTREQVMHLINECYQESRGTLRSIHLVAAQHAVGYSAPFFCNLL